jgi:N-acetylgalactosamine kinase
MIHRKCNTIDQPFFLTHPILKKHISLLKYIRKSYRSEDDIWFIKAPGRVNLIGEHTDYNMGPVLPCAIDREIVFCLRKNNSGEICASNTVPAFKKIQFSLNQPIKPGSKGNWGNYIKAGIHGVLVFLEHSDLQKNELCGFDAIVSSTLPVAAGMSSSSALVVAAALSLLIVNNIYLDKIKLAEICAEAEHFVGTAGGGMDQAASLMGKKDSFLKIEFNPLKVQTIPAPQNIMLILFHSLVEAKKSQSVRKEYNRRVLECQIAVELFNKFISFQLNRNLQPIRYIGEIKPDYFNLSYIDLNSLVSDFLYHLKESYKLEEITELFEVSTGEFTEKYQHILRDDKLSEPADGFKIKGRFQHVYTECRRVDKMIRCLRKNNISGMGQLLLESHESLSKNYEVSTPEVDFLLDKLKSLDVPGARLMGAGFGGMIITLSDKNHQDDLINDMTETFYRQRSKENLDNYIIPCVTSDGADAI